MPINCLLHRSTIHAILFCDLLFTSRIYRAMDTVLAQPILLGVCSSLTIFYALFAMFRGYLMAPAFFALAVGLVIAQLYVFHSVSGVPINFNAAFQYCWAGTFIVFFLAVRDGHGEYLVRMLFVYASCYIVAYAILVLLFQSGFVSSESVAAITSEDPERGQRLFCYGVAAAFAWFGWLYRLRASRTLGSLVMLTVCGLALLSSLSRLLLVIIFCLTLATLFNLSTRAIGKLSLSFFLAVSAVVLFGFFAIDWNPFDIFSQDTSGAFRLWEYDVSREFLRVHPISGVGIPPGANDAWSLVGQDYFAASDLGALGVWFDLGLVGLVLFIAGTFVACRGALKLPESLGTPLALTGCLMAAFGCMAPVIFYPAGVTYFGVLFGFWLDERTKGESISAPAVTEALSVTRP